MKNFILALGLLVLMGCDDSTNRDQKSSSNELLVTNFLKDTSTLERANFDQPLEEFITYASEMAQEAVVLDVNSMSGFIEKGSSFKYAVIVVENHTIVKIEDFTNCKTSSSWATCMTFGEGYVKKGNLVFQKEYINNIIGRPDRQKRMGFLFN